MKGKNSAIAEIVVAKEPGASNVMTISGDADIACCEEICLEFKSNYGLGERWIFDLRAVTFLDSEAIKAILGAIHEVRLNGGNAAMVSIKGSISWRMLNLLGVNKVVHVTENLEEAQDLLNDSS